MANDKPEGKVTALRTFVKVGADAPRLPDNTSDTGPTLTPNPAKPAGPPPSAVQLTPATTVQATPVGGGSDSAGTAQAGAQTGVQAGASAASAQAAMPPLSPATGKAQQAEENIRSKTLPPVISKGAHGSAIDVIGASQTQCNYIFTVGRAGSGKSTFQSHLLRYLLEQREHIGEPDPDFARQKQDYQKTIAEWKKRWVTGAFPDRTFAGKVIEVRLKVTPHKPEYKGQEPIPFGFLEISGEDLEVLADVENPKKLMPSLEGFLNNDKHNLAFVFVCQGSNVDGDDFLFAQFLDYLHINIKRDFRGKCNVVLVLADPDTCQRRLAMAMERDYNGESLDIDSFVKMFTPQTFTKLQLWGERAAIAPFSVGEIEEVKGKAEIRIKTPSFADAGLVYDWLYERFTNRKPNGPRQPGLTERAIGWLANLVGVQRK